MESSFLGRLSVDNFADILSNLTYDELCTFYGVEEFRERIFAALNLDEDAVARKIALRTFGFIKPTFDYILWAPVIKHGLKTQNDSLLSTACGMKHFFSLLIKRKNYKLSIKKSVLTFSLELRNLKMLLIEVIY